MQMYFWVLKIYVSEVLARAVYVHIFCRCIWGFCPPPPPNTKKLATLLDTCILLTSTLWQIVGSFVQFQTRVYKIIIVDMCSFPPSPTPPQHTHTHTLAMLMKYTCMWSQIIANICSVDITTLYWGAQFASKFPVWIINFKKPRHID